VEYPKSDYKRRILALAGDDDLLQSLTRSRDQLLQLFDRLGARWDVSYAPGKWTARQIVAHLADGEIAVGFRLRQSLAEAHHQIQPFDQDAWAQRYARLDPSVARRAFEASRNWNLAFVETLTPEDYARPAFHPERGPEPVGELLRMLVGHDRNHLAQLALIVG
jgi:hypothetical protein